MISARYFSYHLNFKRAAGTSRGVLTQKHTYFLILELNSKKGIGECALFKGLSSDDVPEYENTLQWLCENINLPSDILIDKLKAYPSIVFGYETALRSLASQGGPTEIFASLFSKSLDSIPINGLIWMGDHSFMLTQIKEKVEQGFKCLKLKIGAIDFDQELSLLSFIRSQFSSDQLELRVDANGAFEYSDAMKKLDQLQKFDLHSIEQPIKAGNPEQMAALTKSTPVSIALDEELIGINHLDSKVELLQTINPQYIILKPSLHGGFIGSQEWIDLANSMGIRWWITSALESNIGLNAIAQFAYIQQSNMYQGLGTGGLFTNNIESPLRVNQARLELSKNENWDLSLF